MTPTPPKPSVVELVDAAISPSEIPGLEEALDALARDVDGDVPLPSWFAAYAIALGRRAVDTWRGVRLLAEAGNVSAAAAALRAELEAVILLGWLAADPDDRLVRWHGESERNVRTMITRESDDPVPGRRERLVGHLPPDRLAQRDADIAEGKRRAASAGHTLLLPSVERMAEEAAHPTFWEAYQLAYRLLSIWAHHEHGSFTERVNGNAVEIEDAAFSPFQMRVLAASITAVALILVGEAAGLSDLVDRSRAIRERLLIPPAPPRPATGVGDTTPDQADSP